MKKIIVIGAGLGGLAAGLRLRHAGFEVTLVEKLNKIGGRSNQLYEHGFHVDTGPTILVMKDQFDETYQALGRDINHRVKFTQLDPNYRIYFHDQTHIDLHSNMAKLADELEQVEAGAGEKVFQFLGDNALKYELGMGFVTRNYDQITELLNLTAGLRLIRTGAQENLYQQVARYFKSDKLRKAFSFHSMFLGLSPFDSLAMYALITYADLARGMYYPEGGIYAIIEDLANIAAQDGVEIRTGIAVQKILVKNGAAVGVLLENGESLFADAVVSNADLPYTYGELIPNTVNKKYNDHKLDQLKYACSGYLLYLGVNRTYPDMRHQALYFSEDYRANLDAIFVTGKMPTDPSFHINNPTITDPTLAPAGHAILYVLAPMPNLEIGKINWETEKIHLRDHLLDQLETLVDPHIREHIVWEQDYTPLDFKKDINAVHGNAFGSLAHSLFQSAFFRPHNIARELPGLFFVGQGTYPGIGMPMVLISAKLVTERILNTLQP